MKSIPSAFLCQPNQMLNQLEELPNGNVHNQEINDVLVDFAARAPPPEREWVWELSSDEEEDGEEDESEGEEEEDYSDVVINVRWD